jgi:hypothetical protein
MAKWDAAMQQKHQIDFTETLAKAEQETVKQQTGIKSSQGVVAKIARTTAKASDTQSKALAKAVEEEPRRFAQMKIDHLRYFKNPAQNAGTSKFNYKAWLDGMDSSDFLSELRAHVGNQWFFEKPQHLLEYALQYSNSMPPPFKHRILEELEQVDPEGDLETWLGSGKKRDKHLENMATTGRLWTEGNIFRSSRFAPGSKSTKWQVQLNKEAAIVKKNEKADLAKKMKPTKNNYPEIDQLTQTILANLQKIMESK